MKQTEKVQITCFQSTTDPDTTTPKKVHVPLVIQPNNTLEETKDVRDLYIKLPEHVHDEHKKEFLVSNDRIKYDLRFAKEQQESLPNKMTELYNAGVYGQLTTSLIDTMIIPATHVLDLKAIALEKEIQELKAYKEKIMSSSTSNSPYKSPLTTTPLTSSPSPARERHLSVAKIENYLIELDDDK
ncbi:unnamed protein product [Mucor hiemalis]